MKRQNLSGMTIVRILIDYGDTGFLYCMTIATKDKDVLLNCMKGYSHDVRYLDVKKKAGKNDKGNRMLPDGSIIIGATAFGDKVSAKAAFNKSENRMNLIRKAVIV